MLALVQSVRDGALLVSLLRKAAVDDEIDISVPEGTWLRQRLSNRRLACAGGLPGSAGGSRGCVDAVGLEISCSNRGARLTWFTLRVDLQPTRATLEAPRWSSRTERSYRRHNMAHLVSM